MYPPSLFPTNIRNKLFKFTEPKRTHEYQPKQTSNTHQNSASMSLEMVLKQVEKLQAKVDHLTKVVEQLTAGNPSPLSPNPVTLPTTPTSSSEDLPSPQLNSNMNMEATAPLDLATKTPVKRTRDVRTPDNTPESSPEHKLVKTVITTPQQSSITYDIS